jgi:hypothetical protein
MAVDPKRISKFVQPPGTGEWTTATALEADERGLTILKRDGVAAWKAWQAEQLAKPRHTRAAEIAARVPELPEPEEFEPGWTGPNTDPGRAFLDEAEAQAWAADDAHPFEARAAGNPGALRKYWTAGPGRAKWELSPTPWRTLRKFLSKYLSGDELDRTTSSWYRLVKGHLPNQKGK